MRLEHWLLDEPSEFELMRPTFGGGARPTHSRYTPHVCGLGGTSSSLSRLANPYLGVDLDDTYPAAQPAEERAAESISTPWMVTAMAEIGVTERSGSRRSNPRIMEYFRASRFWGTDDSGASNAWCGSFVAWVMRQNNIEPVARAFRAREWRNFGQRLEQPVYGAIGIKSRVGGGHVAFIVGQSQDGNSYYMLGGNQQNKVQISEYPKRVWDTFVFPPGYDHSDGTLPVHQGSSSEAGSEA